MRVRNIWFTLLLFVLIVAVTVGLISGINSRCHRETIKTLIDHTKPIVALTFDDGPNERYTPQILDILYEKNVPATFFFSGKNIHGNERLLKEIVHSGHELGNHTFSHMDLTELDQEEIISEVKKTKDRIEKIIPGYPLKYVRPPYGRCNQLVEEAIDDVIVLWDIDSGDWGKTDAQTIVNNVLNHVQDGDIIVFHDDNNATAIALEKIISELQARGFQFGTLSALYEAREKK